MVCIIWDFGLNNFRGVSAHACSAVLHRFVVLKIPRRQSRPGNQQRHLARIHSFSRWDSRQHGKDMNTAHRDAKCISYRAVQWRDMVSVARRHKRCDQLPHSPRLWRTSANQLPEPTPAYFNILSSVLVPLSNHLLRSFLGSSYYSSWRSCRVVFICQFLRTVRSFITLIECALVKYNRRLRWLFFSGDIVVHHRVPEVHLGALWTQSRSTSPSRGLDQSAEALMQLTLTQLEKMNHITSKNQLSFK